MSFTEFEGDALDKFPPGAVENAVFAIHRDTKIYAVLQTVHQDGFDVMGLCYKEHADSPLVTRIRVKGQVEEDRL